MYTILIFFIFILLFFFYFLFLFFFYYLFFFFNDTATTENYTFPTRRTSDLCILITFPLKTKKNTKKNQGRNKQNHKHKFVKKKRNLLTPPQKKGPRSEEHTSKTQSRDKPECRLLL